MRDIGVTGVQACALPILDREVGRLVQRIDGLGLREKTLVHFTRDNGPETPNRYPNANRSHEIGRASCRERVQISAVAVSLKKTSGSQPSSRLIGTAF